MLSVLLVNMDFDMRGELNATFIQQAPSLEILRGCFRVESRFMVADLYRLVPSNV